MNVPAQMTFEQFAKALEALGIPTDRLYTMAADHRGITVTYERELDGKPFLMGKEIAAETYEIAWDYE